MIIQCEQCQTKFRLDDSKVTDKGVKVRCAKCKHVFSVKKDQAESEPQADFGALLDQSVSSGNGDDPPTLLAPQQESPAPEPPSGTTFDYSDFIAEDFSIQNGRMDLDAFEPGKDEQAPVAAPSVDEFSLSSLDGDPGFAQEHDDTQTATGEVDFGGFDFNSGVADADKTVVAGALPLDFGNTATIQPPAATPVAETEDLSAFEFGDEPIFGDAGAAPKDGMPEEPINFDTSMNGIADTTVAASAVVDTASATPAEGNDPFSLGEIEFDDEPALAAMQQALSEEQKPDQEQSIALMAGIQQKSGHDAEQDTIGKGPGLETPPAQQEEPPPLSIASRRKHNPAFSVVIAVATVVAVAVLGFFGYSMFFEDKGKVVVEAGRITVRSVDASFVKNPAIGDLLVITGEAVNAFTKPRAAIQVKGMVYGVNGQVLAAKSAYCGNPLTKEQLAGMPLDKIEAAMANQFGDSLANLEVGPGKAIPFVIVISKPPAEAKEYGVEATVSTVATGKQQ